MSTTTSTISVMECDPNVIWNEFCSFKEEEKFLDCELKCDNQSILCHKLVLFCFSPRFRHLLSNLEPFEDPILTFMLPEVNGHDLRSTLDTLYVNLGTGNEKKQLELHPELAKLFGFVDFDPMDTINMDALASLKVEVKSDDDEVDVDEMFGEDAFHDSEDYEYFIGSRKRKSRFEPRSRIKFTRNDPLPLRNSLRTTKVKSELSNDEEKRPQKAKANPDKKKGLMKIEKKQKLEPKVHHCKRCDLIFKGRTSYQRHREEVHYPEMNVQLCCRHCKKEMSLYTFQFHCSYHEVIICDECGKTFVNRFALSEHIQRIHNISKCEECGREFSGRTALDSHKANEHFQGSFSCEICGKRFGSHKQIVLHKYKVHRPKETLNFKCDHCEKKFATYIKRLNHTHSVHLKDYPFKCRHNCGAKYNDCDNLARHEKQKHGKAYPLYHGFEHLRPPKKKK